MQHLSPSQPQPPAFAAKMREANARMAKEGVKPASAGTSKAIVKAAKPKPVSTHVNAKGQPLTCMVGRAGKQCSNPSRHPHGKAWTCTTHDKAIAAGKKLELKGSASKVWTAPSATKPAAAKAASA